jgi:hypothetical protein
MKKNLIILSLAVAGISAHAQSTFSMQLVADNDFAVFAGTTSSITELVYQNNYSWQNQLANLSGMTFTLQPGETTFYLLALGAGGQENISGTINGVDITSIGPVLMSSDVGPSLPGYEGQNSTGGPVDQGIYGIGLVDAQTALSSPSLTWSAASANINTTDTVIQSSPNKIGYDFSSGTARLFEFSASSVGVTAVPEPSTFALAGVGIASLMALRRRK